MLTPFFVVVVVVVEQIHRLIVTVNRGRAQLEIDVFKSDYSRNGNKLVARISVFGWNQIFLFFFLTVSRFEAGLPPIMYMRNILPKFSRFNIEHSIRRRYFSSSLFFFFFHVYINSKRIICIWYNTARYRTERSGSKERMKRKNYQLPTINAHPLSHTQGGSDICSSRLRRRASRGIIIRWKEKAKTHTHTEQSTNIPIDGAAVNHTAKWFI